MRVYKKTKQTKQDLIKLFKRKNIPEKYHERFAEYYNRSYDTLYELAEVESIDFRNEYEDKDFESFFSINEDALDIIFRFTELYMEQINIGHGDEWAYLVADTYKGGEQALSIAFHKLYFENEELAKEELLIHCKFLNADELFANYLLIVFVQKLDFEHPIERVNHYMPFYKEQIESSKSASYAQQYADLMASGKYTEQYCHAYAKLYEYYIEIGKSEKQATLSAARQIESNDTEKFKTIKDRLLERHREYFRDNNLTTEEIGNQVNRKDAFFKKTFSYF